MNCYTEIFDGFDLEFIVYDQIYYNLTISFEIMNNYER